VVTPSLDQIRGALAARPPLPLPEPLPRHAAVAIVLRPAADGLEALLIRRADHPGDFWSGHMAFPGGRAAPGEVSTETAMRETAEEVGLDLRERGELLGGLDELQAIGRGQHMGLSIRPWVFGLRGPAPSLTLSHEVASAHWLRVRDLLDPASQAPFPYVHEGERLVFPSLRVEGLVIWGLTYRMIEIFQEVLQGSPGP
jgi:8-oxo-dGTP pyrophosphatase MutT (NUDIX family)